jgi:hypothetical protein
MSAHGRCKADLACGTLLRRADQSAAHFLAAHGFEVVSMECLGIAHGPDLKHVPLQAAYDLGLRAAAKADADALFMSGTGVHTIGVVGELEKALGKPVITAKSLRCGVRSSTWAAPNGSVSERAASWNGSKPMARHPERTLT